jgi:hypothetical protein
MVVWSYLVIVVAKDAALGVLVQQDRVVREPLLNRVSNLHPLGLPLHVCKLQLFLLRCYAILKQFRGKW